jgi:hypothetical protein
MSAKVVSCSNINRYLRNYEDCLTLVRCATIMNLILRELLGRLHITLHLCSLNVPAIAFQPNDILGLYSADLRSGRDVNWKSTEGRRK